MNPTDYQRQAARTECQQAFSQTRLCGLSVTDMLSAGVKPPDNDSDCLTPVRVNHGLIGVANELGEMTSLFQKWVYYGKLTLNDDLRAKFQDEAGDLLWHLAELHNALGLDLGETMRKNLAKLRVRYPDKWSAERAADENRDRTAEAAAQETPGRG